MGQRVQEGPLVVNTGDRMASKIILVVDDEPDIRRIATIALERLGGFEVFSRASGEAAIEFVRGVRPAVVLLDVMMPGMDGPSTLAQLRQLTLADPVPVIFLTARVQRHDVDRYLGLGAIGVIGKPFDPLTLPTRIAQLLGWSPP